MALNGISMSYFVYNYLHTQSFGFLIEILALGSFLETLQKRGILT